MTGTSGICLAGVAGRPASGKDFKTASLLPNPQFYPIQGIGVSMNMDQAIELTLEQDFSLRNFADMVQKMSREQAQVFLVEQHRLMLVQKTLYQNILKHEWKLGSDLAA